MRYEKIKKRDLIREAFFEEALEIITGKLTDSHLYVELDQPPTELSEEKIRQLKRRIDGKFNRVFNSAEGKNHWHDRHLSIAGENFTEELLEKFIAGESAANGRRRCLVTGGAGFIGSNLVDALIERGDEVAVIDNLSSGKREYLNPRAKFYEVDICNRELIADIFAEEKFDYVFHLAAQIDVRVSVADPALDNKINVLGGLNILENCNKTKVKKIIFISTGGALYGEAEEVPTKESHPTRPLSPYGIHKLTFEKYLHYYSAVFGQKYIALRLANVYGPRQYKGGEAGVVSIFVDYAVNGKKLLINGDGLQTRDFVYVGDVVDAITTATENDYVGEINIATGKETSLLEIIESIEFFLGRKIAKEHLPAKAGEQRRSALDYARAKEIIGWLPAIGLSEGIKKTIEWASGRTER